MRIAINTLPLKTAHRKRGIGYYTRHLLEALKEDSQIQISQFINLKEVKDADIVHFPWFDFAFHTLPVRRFLPTVVTIHDVIPLVFPKHYPMGVRGKINFFLQKMALASCKKIITDSKTSKGDIVKYLKIEEDKIATVHLAADEKFKLLKNETKELYFKRKYHLYGHFLLYVGDANWIKNLPFLIEGFRELIRDPNLKDLKLVLVGGVFLKDVENIIHPELESLKQVNRLIKQYGLESKVIRPGQIEDDELVVFYNMATIYVQPSLYEGFGLPLLEAFACGAPVLCSNKGSLPEIGAQAAVYFDPLNIRQFTSIAKELIENVSIRSKLSKLGFLQAAKFSWKKVAEQTKLIYLEAMKND